MTGSHRQRELIRFVKTFTAENGYPPSRREVAAHMLVSVSTAHQDIERAIGDGFLTLPPHPPGGARALAVTLEGMKLLHPSNHQFNG